jgi:hypothetical protein
MKTKMDYLILGHCLLDKTSTSGFPTTPKSTAIGKSPCLEGELEKI